MRDDRDPVNLLVRCDAGVEIGAGHVMRCLALSQAWIEECGHAGFLCSEIPDALAERLAWEGLTIEHIEGPAGSSDDVAETVARAHAAGAEWVVVDSYRFGSAQQCALREAGLKVLFVDDYGQATHYCAELVLNQNLYASASLYESRETTTRLLLGTRFALLRREFWTWRGRARALRPDATRALVTLGGSDARNASLSVLEALAAVGRDDLDVVLVMGPASPHEPSLDHLSRHSDMRVVFERAVKDMPALMAWADIAISAAGSTTWELLFMGLPALVVSQAGNQEPIAKALEESGAALRLDAEDTTGWPLAIARLLGDTALRNRLSTAGQGLVDGFGARRVARAMLGRGER